MLRFLCKSKIHKATVTEANIHYEGSITIDRALMDAADLLPFERVQIANLRTGVRLETYVIEGKSNSGIIGMNGAAALLAEKGDEIHIISYCALEDELARNIQPKIIHVNSQNMLTAFTHK